MASHSSIPMLNDWYQAVQYLELQKQDMKQLADEEDQDETQPSVPVPFKLSPFFDSGSLSDITLMVGSSIFQTHKLIISSWSAVFKEILLERPKSDEPYVLEEAREYEAIFSDFLKFMYTGMIEISNDTVYSFHKLSKMYEVEEICDLCEEFLIGEVSNDIIALKTVTDAEEFGITKVYDHCFKFLETNFFRLSDSFLKKMSPSLFLKFLESSDLVVQDETHLFNQAVDWLYKGGNEYQEYTKDVISKIHFDQMSDLELTRTQVYDGLLEVRCNIQKSLNDSGLQDSIHDAFELKEKKQCVDPRIYIKEPVNGYQHLSLLGDCQNKLKFSVTGVSAYNTLSEDPSTWSVTGSKLYDNKSKKWKICYRLKPSQKHIDYTYRLAILTNAGRPCMNPMVTTSKGDVAGTVVKVEQILHDTKAIKKLKSVEIKVVIMVKITKLTRELRLNRSLEFLFPKI